MPATAIRTAPIDTPDEAVAVVDFWRDAGPSFWFAKNAAFDKLFRERFLSLYEAAALGAHDDWLETAEGALALLILLDQFPRNAFRGIARMFATDEKAREIAESAIAAGHDRTVEDALQLFFYMPFAHSESLRDQERSVALCARLAEPSPKNSRRHHDIVKRFGRFPHRNPILDRTTTAEEQAFLDEGGYAG
jgi:uncharacterized protein (DUF924 family)